MGLGLTSGKMYIDNYDLYKISNSENLYRWRNLIAHVPQDIFLTDQTIAENIALGIAPEEINFDKVIYAAKESQDT